MDFAVFVFVAKNGLVDNVRVAQVLRYSVVRFAHAFVVGVAQKVKQPLIERCFVILDESHDANRFAGDFVFLEQGQVSESPTGSIGPVGRENVIRETENIMANPIRVLADFIDAPRDVLHARHKNCQLVVNSYAQRIVKLSVKSRFKLLVRWGEPDFGKEIFHRHGMLPPFLCALNAFEN